MPPREPDSIDWRILAELQADARITQTALAARVGLSRSSLQERMARLERDGTIAAYTIRLQDGLKKTAFGAYLLLAGNTSQPERIVAHLKTIPEVLACDSISGDWDFLLYVEGQSPIDFNRVRDLVAQAPGIARTQTLFVLASRFDRR